MGKYTLKWLEGMFQERHMGQNSDRGGGEGILVAAALKIYLAKNNCILFLL